MTTLGDKILARMNCMRELVLKDAGTVEKLRAAAAAHKRSEVKYALEALLDSPFQEQALPLIIDIAKKDFWRHRRAIISQGSGLGLDRSVVAAKDPEVLAVWDMLTPHQQEGVLKYAYSLVTMLGRLAEEEGWDDANITDWERPQKK